MATFREVFSRKPWRWLKTPQGHVLRTKIPQRTGNKRQRRTEDKEEGKVDKGKGVGIFVLENKGLTASG